MNRKWIAIIFLIFSKYIYSQNNSLRKDTTKKVSFLVDSDTLNKQRFRTIAITASSIYGGTLIGFNSMWYKNYPRSSFHVYNDNKEWMKMDKMGHLYGAYFQTLLMTDMFQWTGYSRRKSILFGGLSGIAYQSVIEMLDAYSMEWGFSWGDMVSNSLGVLLATSQDYFWHDEQRIGIKFSGHKINYASGIQRDVANSLYGKELSSRILKDYNGQTYWLSVNPYSFSKTTRFPKWLNIALGFGADGMFGGFNNDRLTQIGIVVPRSRQIFISPDIDLSKINTRSPFLKFAFNVLNIIKVPLPTIEYHNTNGFKYHWLYF